MNRPKKLLPRFRESGFEGMLDLHESNRRFLYYRLKTAFWQGLSGIRFFWFLKTLNKHARLLPEVTVAEAAWNFLEEIGFRLRVDWRFDNKTLKDFPVLFYSDHPSYIEPLLNIAALKEFDPKVVATAWVKNMTPLLSQLIIAVPDSLEVVRKSLRGYRGVRRLLETIWAHLIVIPVTRHLQGDVSAGENRLLRISAFRAIMGTLLDNENVLLFPQGGEGQKPWVKDHTQDFKRLIEILLRSRRKNPLLNQLRLVPVIISRFSIRTFFKSRFTMSYHPLYFPFRFLPDRPFDLVVREQFVLEELAESYNDTESMVNHLMARARI